MTNDSIDDLIEGLECVMLVCLILLLPDTNLLDFDFVNFEVLFLLLVILILLLLLLLLKLIVVLVAVDVVVMDKEVANIVNNFVMIL